MKATTLLLPLLCILGSSSALPAEPITKDLAPRGNNGANECTVAVDAGRPWQYGRVRVWGDWVNDNGKGFHDNLDGYCGPQTVGWWATSFSRDRTGGAATVDFVIATSPQEELSCIQNAIWKASEATGAIWGVQCTWA